MKRKTVHLIANAHIDPVWLWHWEEGFGEVIHTCAYMVELLNKKRELTFNRGNANSFLWIEEAEPYIFKEIKKLVKRKKWFICNPWWEEADCNIPCGESFIRHLIYGKKYFKKKFNIDVNVVCNPDSFGHNGNLPQILKKAGIKFYVFFRPTPEEKDLPQIFWWEGIDGSIILACRPPFFYATWDESEVIKGLNEIKNYFFNDLDDILFFFGVGNHGGGPTLRFLQVIEELKPKLPFLELKYSSLYDFYKKIIRQKQKIPIFKGELQYTCRGCYTSLIKIKFLNRYAENKLQTAEILSSISYKILNKEYPSLKIEKNWRKILFCQFHDIIAGTSIPKAYEDCLGLIESSIVFSKKLINENLWSISNVISTDNIEGFPVLFFNPTSFEREEVKRISFVQRYGYDFIIPKEIEFFDANNKEIYSQSIEEPNTGRKEYLVKVKIPPYGFNVYWWRPSTQQKKNYNLILKDNIIENQKLLVGIDKEKSGFRVILKEKNIDLFKEYGGIFLVIEDYSNAWGHGYSSFRDVIGKFDILELYNGENGNCMVSIFYKLVYNNSEIHQEVILYDGLPYIEVKGKIFWTEKNKFLKISFPLNLNNCKIYAEIPYGYIERPSDGNENPCQRWVEIIGMKEDEKVGVGFINCGWYGYDFFENELRISALRSPVYASLKDPQKLEKNKFYDFQSYGINEFKYWILPHLGEINSSNVVKYAYFLNNEIEYILPLRKKGYYSPPFSFINVSPENIVLSCIKKEENGDNIIFRLYEAYGEKTDAKIEIFGRKFMIKFDKFEIKTLKFFKKIKKLKEVDLNEERSLK